MCLLSQAGGVLKTASGIFSNIRSILPLPGQAARRSRNIRLSGAEFSKYLTYKLPQDFKEGERPLDDFLLGWPGQTFDKLLAKRGYHLGDLNSLLLWISGISRYCLLLTSFYCFRMEFTALTKVSCLRFSQFAAIATFLYHKQLPMNGSCGSSLQRHSISRTSDLTASRAQ